MPSLNHSVIIQDQAISADGVFDFDLPVNPLSCILLALRPLNETSTLANFAAWLSLARAVNRATISYRGESVLSMRGEDIAALNYFRHGIIPMQANPDNTDNERRCYVLPLLLGRNPYDPKSCFPASRRGELVLSLDLDIADTGYDGLRISAESIELLGARPSEYERKVALSQSFAATGINIVDLAPGNLHRGILLWGTTGFAGASPVPSWGRTRLKLDNQEVAYSATDFEVLQVVSQLWGRQAPMIDHKHTLNAAGAGIEETTSTFDAGDEAQGSIHNYAFMDLDPTRDDMFSVDTRDRSRFHMEVDAETADAVRATPIEVVKLSA